MLILILILIGCELYRNDVWCKIRKWKLEECTGTGIFIAMSFTNIRGSYCMLLKSFGVGRTLSVKPIKTCTCYFFFLNCMLLFYSCTIYLCFALSLHFYIWKECYNVLNIPSKNGVRNTCK